MKASPAVRKPEHWTTTAAGYCHRCRTVSLMDARHTYDPVRGQEQIETTCRDCKGLVSRRSVMLGSRR